MTETRSWQTGEEIEIEASSIIGEKRVYRFKELNQEHGSEIFHNFVMIVITHWSDFRGLIETNSTGPSARRAL